MKAAEIEKRIDDGETLVFSTYLKAQRIDKKCLDSWRKAGVNLFKDGDKTGFYIGRGRRYDFVIESVSNIRWE